MRRVECLEPNAEGYRLHRQFKLDELFSGLSGAEKVLEADVGPLMWRMAVYGFAAPIR
jgi:hypothetical protein